MILVAQGSTFALAPGASEILRAPFKSVISVSPQSWGAPASKPCWPSKPSALGAHLPSAGIPACRAQRGAQNFCPAVVLQFVGHPPGSDYIASPPLLPVLLWFLRYVFSGRSFLVGSSFSSMIVLQIVVILVCSREEVTSGSFHSSILATPPRKSVAQVSKEQLSRDVGHGVGHSQ